MLKLVFGRQQSGSSLDIHVCTSDMYCGGKHNDNHTKRDNNGKMIFVSTVLARATVMKWSDSTDCASGHAI